MAANYASHVSTRQTPQSEPIPGKRQVQNSAGGYSFSVDCWTRLERFLILGNQGGSYYASERKLTKENAAAVAECYAVDPERTIRVIAEISDAGRAPKNDPAIFALAMLSRDQRALDALPIVCRIPTHLFQFVDAARHFRGWGRAFQRAIQRWYLDRDVRQLSYHLTKYQQRDGWSHRDVLRLAKPKPENDAQQIAFGWATGKVEGFADEDAVLADSPLEPIYVFERAKHAGTRQEVVKLIRNHGLVRECVPTQWLNEPEIWDALLDRMPLTAMIRNLGKMSAIGLLKPLSNAASVVADRLRDADSLKKARVHPLSVLVAQRIYAQGRGMKGSLTWNPVPQVVDALDDAFYLAFDAVEPTGKRWLLGVDVSGSMSWACIGGMPLRCSEAAAAMAMVAMRTESQSYAFGFSSHFRDLGLSPKMRLNDVIRATGNLTFGRTDCAVPMLHALEHGIEADVFVIYTDNETWAGNIHPCQALQRYREKTGIPAKLVVVGMVSNGFSIADSNDAGMLDVVGFDTAVPQVMADFAKG